MKELVLIISHVNWDMVGPGDWKNTEWKIYNDLSVEKKITYNILNNNIKTYNYVLTTENYDNLLKNIQLSKDENIKINAYDGSAWEITQYKNGVETWKRELGYIYGIKSLEEIAQLLNNIM